MFEMTSLSEEAPSFLHKVGVEIAGWFYPKLIRRNQTLNEMSAGYEKLASPECSQPKSEKCSAHYENVTGFTAATIFINPVGRSMLGLFLPKVYGTRVKQKLSVDKLNEMVAAL